MRYLEKWKGTGNCRRLGKETEVHLRAVFQVHQPYTAKRQGVNVLNRYLTIIETESGYASSHLQPPHLGG